MNGKSYKNAYAFQKDGEYYLYTQGSFLRRHAQGKINVYCGTVRNNKMLLDRNGDRVLLDNCYYQFGESGSVLLLSNILVLRKIVADCPKAVAMLDYNKKELNRRMKKDPNYYLKVIDTYNNCQ